MSRLVSLGVALFLVSSSSHAFQWGADGTNQGHVIRVDADYIGTQASASNPASVYFRLDADVGVCPGASTCCPANTWLYWSSSTFNDANSTNETIREVATAKGTLSSVQLALALSYKVELYGFYPVNGQCQIQYIHLLNTQ